MENRKIIKVFPKNAFPPSFLLLRVKTLVKHPAFGALTLVGNGTILCGATALYFLEAQVNKHIYSFLDALWWAVATVTTVGYGEVSPVTTLGKILGILMMIFGTAIFCSFTGLFASVLLKPDFDVVEEEVEAMERSVQRLESEVVHDEHTLNKIAQDLETALATIRQLKKDVKSK